MRGVVGVCLLFGVLMSVGAAQEAPIVYRSGIDVVALNVVVTDPQGRFVGGLSGEDFTVLEDGAPQQVTFFSIRPIPTDLALLLDTSASMTDKMATVQQAAIGFTAVVRPGDRITIVDVKDVVKVLHPLDGDVAAARDAIESTIPSGNTSLYNGLYMALREMAKQRLAHEEVRRQAIVVLSDGEDTSSLVGFEDVLELGQQSGIAIYTITLRPAYGGRALVRDVSSRARAEFAMKALAQQTGARAFFPADVGELTGVYAAIGDELSRQYTLGYAPKNAGWDGAYRRIDVRVERPGARVRTRTGYFATSAVIAAREPRR